MKKILIGSFLLISWIGFTTVASAQTVQLKSPTSCLGTWQNCHNAYTDDSTYANSAYDVTAGIWGNYGFSTSTGSTTISSIIVKPKAWVDDCDPIYAMNLSIYVSKDGGTNWGPQHSWILPCTNQSTSIDVTADYAWQISDLSDSNFKVKAVCESGSILRKKDNLCHLDWIPVELTTL